jgi:hypothetical protein
MAPALPTVYLPNTSGCSARGFTPVTFSPDTNTAYDLVSPEAASNAVLASKKVSVVGNDPLTVVYKLERHNEMNPTIVWYRWTVRGSTTWDDNFSEKLRVGNLRILTGDTQSTDPNSGRLTIENPREIRPHASFLRHLSRPACQYSIKTEIAATQISALST